jgi:hypothetical protein
MAAEALLEWLLSLSSSQRSPARVFISAVSAQTGEIA